MSGGAYGVSKEWADRLKTELAAYESLYAHGFSVYTDTWGGTYIVTPAGEQIPVPAGGDIADIAEKIILANKVSGNLGDSTCT